MNPKGFGKNDAQVIISRSLGGLVVDDEFPHPPQGRKGSLLWQRKRQAPFKR